ncbi:S-adenosyl-L-methionine-dependent methyltransferase [Ascobolus immersus RN42]|uniref:S-adenosyl-L-methionine-dependent methyltransferase n=1 Tax=Ascobolus immersus RN42 TaxID=1160509 RepID=A0A3N4HP65_ASCIM|nr:S-adenosyl-L-methionine-dependent methyltransferase [Ascobolus immersus RN42]
MVHLVHLLSSLPISPSHSVFSLTSSITDYTYENGRRYHSYRAGKYALPNDTLEAERLDIVHHLSLLFLSGDLYTSPVRQLASSGRLRRALDAGTGTGIWAMEFGHEFPGCEVVGVDLSPIQPTHVPPNVRFEVDDLEDEWLWDAPFDYIHIRTLLGSIASWPTFLSNCYAHTTPGGYVELQEIDLTNVFSADGTYESHAHAYQHYNSLLFQAGHLTGRRFDLAPELPRMMQEAGFVDVKVQRFTQPLGHWPRRKREREIAFWSVESMVSGLEAYGLALFTRVLGVGMEEARGVCERARRDLLREGVHTCCTWWMVSGRRPEEGEGGDEEMDG